MIDLQQEHAINAAADGPCGPLLSNLQAGILESYHRDHVRLLMLRFTAEPESCRKGLRAFVEARVTSARRHLDEVTEVPGKRSKGPICSLFLAAAGYEALGFDPAELQRKFTAPSPFFNGMVQWAWAIQDRCKDWEEPYKKERRIHALVFLGEVTPARADRLAAKVEAELKGFAAILGKEAGAALRDEDGRSREPFGYVDGLSQPLFFQQDLEKQKRRDGIHPWNPLAPLSLVLVRDPYAGGEDCFGSYLAFRKLEQDVEGFDKRIEVLAAKVTQGDKEMARALVAGRFSNGTPVLMSPMPSDNGLRDFNNFDYSADSGGGRCPFHSHIRKANPRSDKTREKRIVRRGIPYHQEDGRQGLLFLSFQSDLLNQFISIQAGWMNRVDFPQGATGIDPLAGRSGDGNSTQRWPQTWGEAPKGEDGFSFRDFVTCRGGEYFFAPSLPFLRKLDVTAGT